MDDRKYELVKDDKQTVNGVEVYRIRALRDMMRICVRVGDLGGYVQSEDNLSHSGFCWVYGSAVVYANAHVMGDASVSNAAHVYGTAVIADDARVQGRARVYDDARVRGRAVVERRAAVYGSAQVYEDASISDDADVYGGAQVKGSARIRGSSQISDTAWVYGSASVRGNAVLAGDCCVFDSVRVDGAAIIAGDVSIGGSPRIRGLACIRGYADFVTFTNVGTEQGTLCVYETNDGGLECTRGCFYGSVEEFLNESKLNHSPRLQREYRLLLEVAVSRIRDRGRDLTDVEAQDLERAAPVVRDLEPGEKKSESEAKTEH